MPLPHDAPNLAALRHTAQVFAGFANVDATWLALIHATRPGIDLSRADHRTLLLRWLNSWGCRIRYPREGEPAPFDSGVAQWWDDWSPGLPKASLVRLEDRDLERLGDAYAALSAVEVSGGATRRTLGPTAAAKALYALRPRSVLLWDAAIAEHLYGVRDGTAFTEHQRLGRRWGRLALDEAGLGEDEDTLPVLVGRPTVSLAKLLDEYLYVTITLAKAAG